MSYFEINNLRIDHHSFEGTKTVLDIEHLAIEKGETYGLVGESGQGKTVLALAHLIVESHNLSQSPTCR